MEAETGIIGGSGFYEFLEGEEVAVETPFGEPSDKILLSEYAGKKIAFLPRHGKKHQYPPHRINFKANLYAMKKLGVKRIIAPSAVGSLKPAIEPGHFVICDQFLNLTGSRADTFFNGPGAREADLFGRVAHVSTAEPYCPHLRDLAVKACSDLKVEHHKDGTVLVIEGPRFSTRAESRFFANFADIVNMTQYPEVVLARELEMCYLNISLVTDYDAGLAGRPDIKAVSGQDVSRMFKENSEKVKQIILEIIKNMPPQGQAACDCNRALKDAFL
ncbi:MAG: S-methyl-5'-thioadenosine phosphorylase [Candidatus Pacebacteria bacterium]|nr:S-methyl-5'-thioadenosine phosphorylase [Candidatus Paceibacterota bacterium]